MQLLKLTEKRDFVELKYSGYANGELFDSNIENDLEKLNPQAKAEKLIVIIGEGMVISGLDKALEKKEYNKKYEIELEPEEAFGNRRKELIKIIPMKNFVVQKINPKAGMLLVIDNMLAKIISVSGARVVTDFNNPLAGKKIKYIFEIVREVEDEKEKIETVLKLLFKSVLEYETSDGNVIVKLEKNFENLVDFNKEKFKELVGKNLIFKEK